jgi:gliding motility-associated protein GldM
MRKRQKTGMISLVFMGLLLINSSCVQNDIQKAFKQVGSGLENANTDYSNKSTKTMAEFDELYKKDSSRIKLLYENAQKATRIADSLYDYLQDIKEMMARKANGWTDSNKIAVDRDQDLEIAEDYFVKNDNGKNGKELRQKLEDFDRQMKNLLIDKNGKPTPEAADFKIDTKEERVDRDGTTKQWHEYYFGEVPVIAAITELTKFQNDVRNAEAEVIHYLSQQAQEHK